MSLSRQNYILQQIEEWFVDTDSYSLIVPVYPSEDGDYLLSVIRSAGYKAELKGPRLDDQVDAMTRALNWAYGKRATGPFPGFQTIRIFRSHRTPRIVV